ncbi:AIM24 family protein [Deinococcus sp. Marseille-Q6407]|uniref:AIM24 family protein n=1 Tax=Deinococcus sp. Marseille-Q6407 TaxID=2969223 RepID=UPI0021BFD3BB|nr:AIM24 family protein [Deinococcus sp. Marseille-Q6407]
MTQPESGRSTEPAASPEDAGSTRLQDFLRRTAERDNPGDVFELESPRMLEATVNGRIWSKLGAMVAYKGDLAFQREGMLAGGMMKALKRAVTSEMSPLTRIEGRGVCYLADQGKQITVLRLEGDSLNVNGNDLLAFEDSISYDITMHRRMAGWASGGLFSVRLSGHGLAAILSHGQPLTLPVRPGEPVITDPNATVAWSDGLSPDLKVDLSLRSLLGRGGGETYQMVFEGSGFVVVQPYEEKPVLISSD